MPIELEELDSTGTMPPDFGPGFPVYPVLESFVRTTGPSIGSNVYPGLAQQSIFNALGLPAFRDREQVFLWEPNGIILGAGYYDARLVSSYGGLPLYATHCCATGNFPSSSSSSLSSSPGPTCDCSKIKSINLDLTMLGECAASTGTYSVAPGTPCAFRFVDNFRNVIYNLVWSPDWFFTVTTFAGLIFQTGNTVGVTDCTAKQTFPVKCLLDNTMGSVTITPILGP